MSEQFSDSKIHQLLSLTLSKAGWDVDVAGSSAGSSQPDFWTIHSNYPKGLSLFVTFVWDGAPNDSESELLRIVATSEKPYSGQKHEPILARLHDPAYQLKQKLRTFKDELSDYRSQWREKIEKAVPPPEPEERYDGPLLAKRINTGKSLEQLENDYWGPPTYPSHLVTTCHALRSKPLRYFVVEDMRILIGQNISLDYLIPMALECLFQDIMISGDLYDGDLLSVTLRSDKDWWDANPEHKADFTNLIKMYRPIIEQEWDWLSDYGEAASIEWFCQQSDLDGQH